YREALTKSDVPPYLERFVGYALDKAGDQEGALEYFRQLRLSMGNPPDPARKPEVVDREISRLENKLRKERAGTRR
ncbi:MAG: hypothetical protein EBW05_06710, partial [Betaproteobacteria bacterium]|nr:hypothetical protein [Betaproteobacteria bacterium]